jgi:hypothetical protein
METVDRAMWTELGGKREVNSYRRILQREYVQNLGGILLKPPAPCPEDAVSLARHLLRRAQGNIAPYLKRNPKVELATRAHLEDLSDEIIRVLKATITHTVP